MASPRRPRTIATRFWPMAARGVARRCPRCGGRGAWFTGWFRRGERCRTCGYKYERQDGFSLGAVTMNTIVTFGLLAVWIAVSMIATYPDIAVIPILVVAFVITAIVPIAFFPVSYTLWAAFDLAMHPLEPAELEDADRHRADGVELVPARPERRDRVRGGRP